MRFEPLNNTISGIEKGDFYCYEIKSSVEDFRSKNGHNFIGDYNYYVMPSEVYQKVSAEIPFGVGVYCPEGSSLVSVRKARSEGFNKGKRIVEQRTKVVKWNSKNYMKKH